jgi:hypothetical protein
MLWLKKKADIKASDLYSITPSELDVEFSPNFFSQKLQQILSDAAELGGIESFVESLQKKSELFQNLFAESDANALDEQAIETLLDCVFTARRKLPQGMAIIGHARLSQAIVDLVASADALPERIQNFVDVFPEENKKVRKAAWDFAAEILHFSNPEQYPLMSRWVWDAKAQSGALREFIRANDTLPNIAIENTAEDFEAGRVWLSEQLNEAGFYRDVHFVVDLVMAQAYTDYVLAMSNGMGMMGSEFGAKMEPIEFVLKLLGIDATRKDGKSRVKKISVH